MKSLRWFLIVALLVGYFLWPYHATRKFARMAVAGDANGISDMTDYPALRESLKEIIVESAVIREREIRGRQQDEATIRAEARKIVETPGFDQHLRAYVNADALKQRMLAAGKEFKEDTVWQNETWLSPWEFSVEDVNGGRLKFRFTGTAWKLSGLQLSREEMRRLVHAGTTKP